jgi:dolichol kinase
VYADAGAVVEIKASSYVSVNKVPVVFAVAEVNIGARKSGATEELLIAATPDTDNMSLPVVSCIAAFVVDELSCGAVYDTVTV